MLFHVFTNLNTSPHVFELSACVSLSSEVSNNYSKSKLFSLKYPKISVKTFRLLVKLEVQECIAIHLIFIIATIMIRSGQKLFKLGRV